MEAAAQTTAQGHSDIAVSEPGTWSETNCEDADLEQEAKHAACVTGLRSAGVDSRGLTGPRLSMNPKPANCRLTAETPPAIQGCADADADTDGRFLAAAIAGWARGGGGSGGPRGWEEGGGARIEPNTGRVL